MSSLKLNIFKEIFDAIADEGQKIIDRAAATNTTRLRTGNMKDAYGAALYYKGQRVRTRYVNDSPQSRERHHGWAKHGIPDATGREYLNKFFDTYRPKSNLELVCVNAAYYSGILEDGAQARPRRNVATKYKIISQTMSSMQQLARKWGGKLTIIK